MSSQDRRPSGLDEIPNLLDRVGGGGGTPSSCSRNNNCVTLAMLNVNNKRFEEKFEKPLQDLRRALDQEKEGRSEDIKNLSKCIKNLVEEVQNLKSWVTVLETKLEDNMASRSPPAVIPSTSANSTGNPGTQAVDPEILRQMKREIGEDTSNNPNSATNILAEQNAGGNPPLDRPKVRTRKRKPGWKLNISRKKGRKTAAAPAMNEASASSSGIGTEPMDTGADAEGDPEVVHGKSSSGGRFLDVVCLCGLEYDTLRSLSVHVVEQQRLVTKKSTPQAQAKPINMEPPTAGPSTAISKEQARDSNVSTLSTSTEPPSPASGPVEGDGHVQLPKTNARGRAKKREKKFPRRWTAQAQPRGRDPRPKKPTRAPAPPKPSTSAAGTGAAKQMQNGKDTSPATPIRSKRISAKLAKKTKHEADPTKSLHCICGVQCRDETALQSHISCKIMTVSLRKIVTTPKNTPQKRRESENALPSPANSTSNPLHMNQEPQQVEIGDNTLPSQMPPPSPSPQFHCKCGKKYGSKGALNLHIRKLLTMNEEPGTHVQVGIFL